jgi:hypothetical protein
LPMSLVIQESLLLLELELIPGTTRGIVNSNELDLRGCTWT